MPALGIDEQFQKWEYINFKSHVKVMFLICT